MVLKTPFLQWVCRDEISPFGMICYRFTNGRFVEPTSKQCYSLQSHLKLWQQATHLLEPIELQSASTGYLLRRWSTTKANASCK
jgi:hypothetical protein